MSDSVDASACACCVCVIDNSVLRDVAFSDIKFPSASNPLYVIRSVGIFIYSSLDLDVVNKCSSMRCTLAVVSFETGYDSDRILLFISLIFFVRHTAFSSSKCFQSIIPLASASTSTLTATS